MSGVESNGVIGISWGTCYEVAETVSAFQKVSTISPSSKGVDHH
jgi:hypothetical protein